MAGKRGPLSGIRIAVTRPEQDGKGFAETLSASGAEVLVTPLIAIRSCYNPEALAAVLRRATEYDWVVFTSANGVKQVFRFAEEQRLRAGLQEGRFACIGPATAKALRRWGVEADLVPEVYQAEGLLASFREKTVEGKRFLLLRARGARGILREVLLGEGAAEVKELAIYEAAAERSGMNALRSALDQRVVNCVTFTSASTVRAFARVLDEIPAFQLKESGVRLASIGPVTSDELRAHKLRVDIEAARSTTEGLARALEEYYGERRVGTEVAG